MTAYHVGKQLANIIWSYQKYLAHVTMKSYHVVVLSTADNPSRVRKVGRFSSLENLEHLLSDSS